MPSQIVVFGATGYTGRLTAEQLVAQGARPLLAGRSELRLAELAERLGGLEHRVADVDRPQSVAELARAGRRAAQHGRSVQALGRAGGRGRDRAPAGSTSTRPASRAFIRRVFDVHDGPARRAGATLLPAIGYDFVPGALAGALALEAAGDGAVRVDVGYYALGGSAASLSRGTKASLAGVALDPAFAFRGGRIVTVRSAERRPLLRGARQGPPGDLGRRRRSTSGFRPRIRGCARSTSTSAGSARPRA